MKKINLFSYVHTVCGGILCFVIFDSFSNSNRSGVILIDGTFLFWGKKQACDSVTIMKTLSGFDVWEFTAGKEKLWFEWSTFTNLATQSHHFPFSSLCSGKAMDELA